jgi:hypothetical protein
MTGFFKEIFSSLYDSSTYGEVAREKQGIGATFMLFLTVLTMAFASVLIAAGYAAAKDAINSVPAIVADLPAMTIKDGKLTIDKPVPYEVKLGSGPDMMRIVIDTNYKIADLGALHEKMKQEKIISLITADAIVVPGQNDELKVEDLKDVQQPVMIDHAGWQKLAQVLKDWGIAFLAGSFAIFGFIGLFLFNLIATFCTAIVVTIAGAMAGAALAFDASMRLAALLRIPVTIISYILSLIGLTWHIVAIGWLLWFGYIIFAVVAAKRAPVQA